MNGIAQPTKSCSFSLSTIVTSATLSGSPAVCINGNNIYTVNNLEVGCTVAWSTSNTAIATVSNGTNSQVQVNAVANGLVYLYGTITNPCGQSITITKLINVGAPVITNFGISGPSNPNVFTGSTSSFSVPSVAGVTNYVWSITSSPNCGCYTNASGLLVCPRGTILPSISGSGTNATVQWGNCPGGYTVNCSAVNNCGDVGVGNFPIQTYTYTSGGGTPCETVFTVYPNPVKGQSIEVSIAPPPGPCLDAMQSYRTSRTNDIQGYSIASIYNMQGIKVFENKYEGEKSFTITDFNLKAGNYFLNIDLPDGETKKQIIVVK